MGSRSNRGRSAGAQGGWIERARRSSETDAACATRVRIDPDVAPAARSRPRRAVVPGARPAWVRRGSSRGRTSRSSRGPPRPKRWSGAPRSSATTRSASPTATACTDWCGPRRRPRRTPALRLVAVGSRALTIGEHASPREHRTVHVASHDGYKNLCQILTESHRLHPEGAAAQAPTKGSPETASAGSPPSRTCAIAGEGGFWCTAHDDDERTTGAPPSRSLRRSASASPSTAIFDGGDETRERRAAVRRASFARARSMHRSSPSTRSASRSVRGSRSTTSSTAFARPSRSTTPAAHSRRTPRRNNRPEDRAHPDGSPSSPIAPRGSHGRGRDRRTAASFSLDGRSSTSSPASSTTRPTIRRHWTTGAPPPDVRRSAGAVRERVIPRARSAVCVEKGARPRTAKIDVAPYFLERGHFDRSGWRGAATSCARGEEAPPTARSVTACASRRSTPRGRISSSSASSPPSGKDSPTSTSTSSTSGAEEGASRRSTKSTARERAGDGERGDLVPWEIGAPRSGESVRAVTRADRSAQRSRHLRGLADAAVRPEERAFAQ